MNDWSDAVGQAELNAASRRYEAASIDVGAAQDRSVAAFEERRAAEARNRPSMLLRPGLSIDGTQWCALYGENLQDGVAGFGSSPEEAFVDFDRAWAAPLPAARSEAAKGDET